jgi:imidazole glycerol-phosphate synthase subunit HisH
MIAIIDYGMGNIHSVQKALESMGAKTMVTNKPEDIRSCDKAVLPGVGAFDDAMLELSKQNLVSALSGFVRSGNTLLGICLGMQLLFETSQEAKVSKGLGFLRGGVIKFDNKHDLKVPHMGWNQINKTKSECPLLKGIPEKAYVYFCHSFYPDPKDRGIIAATTDYGIDFTSILWQDNMFGVQFHPEKSQEIGLKMLKNFVEL